MAAFLSIDLCQSCGRNLPWEYVPAVSLNGKPLAGTGVWRSQLIDDCCPGCRDAIRTEAEQMARNAEQKAKIIELFGGPQPYREFTFDRYVVDEGNRLAFERCRNFDPASEGLYLWGPCGVGKTHLAFATVRKCLEESLSAELGTPWQLVRQLRMKEPSLEQEAIQRFTKAEVVLIDDIGKGSERPFARQLLQEIFDNRRFNDRRGVIVTSQHSLDDLAIKLKEDSLPSRLAETCTVIELSGPDHRVRLL